MSKSRSRASLQSGHSTLRSSFSRIDIKGFTGYIYDEADLDRRYAVDILLDGYPIRLLRADVYANELASDGIGDGCYGFSFVLPEASIADGAVIEARLANSTAALDLPIALQRPFEAIEDIRGFGSVSWIGGLRFQGWVRGEASRTPTVLAMIDGETVAQTRATQWTHIGGFEDAQIVRAFELQLPFGFADGTVKRVSFVTDDRRSISTSPVAFVAFPDGVVQFFSRFDELKSERPRARLLEYLMPMSAPFSNYKIWKERFPEVAPEQIERPLAVVLVGAEDEAPSLESLEDQRYPDWIAAALPETHVAAAFDTEPLLQFLTEDAAHCGHIVFALAGTLFGPHALQRLNQAFDAFPGAEAVYGDLELMSDDGKLWPLALPAFDYERMLEQGYCAHLFAMTRPAALRALEAGADSLYRMLNSIFDGRHDAQTAESLVHVPDPIGCLPEIEVRAHSQALALATAAHLKSRGVAADVAPSEGNILPAVHVVRRGHRPSTTIVIPVRNRQQLLQTCLESIGPAVRLARADIMVVDNDSSEPEMLDYLAKLQRSGITIVRAPGPFNYARLNNLAAKKSDSELLCLLNNDIKAMDSSWLGEMQSRIESVDVGAVGALLSWPNGVVQHGGVVLGASFAAVHACNDRMDSDPGYGDMLRVAHECSAVTAACLLTRRSDYMALDGMDETRFPVNFNDVDYCLKLRSIGKRIVFTPHARLLHFESASRGADTSPDKASRFDRELRNLRAKWGEYLVKDSYYNPILSLDPIPFSALAWPPRDRSVRTPLRPDPVSVPAGF